MSEFVDYLLSEAPWLRPAFAWSIALLFVFLFLTPLSYFALWPLFIRIRQALAVLLLNLKRNFAEAKIARARQLDNEADTFLADGGLWRLSSNAASQWSSELRRVTNGLKRLVNPINRSARALDSSNKQVPDMVRTLHLSQIGASQALPSLPSAHEIVDSVADHRVALLKLILASLILFAIMTVNTVMLSQILRDLGVIPQALSFFGIPLAYIVAFLMTAIEAGLGIAHSATRSKNPDKFSVWAAFFTVLAFLVSLVEGFFWSRIAPAHGSFTLPFVNYDMPQPSLFFCFGFALVWTLFGLGSIGFEAFAEVLRGRHGDLLSRALANLRHQHSRYTSAVLDASKIVGKVSSEVSSIDQKLQGPAANAESVRESLDKLRREIEDRRKTSPDWANDDERQLTRSEVYELAQKAALWLVLSLVSGMAMTLAGLATVSNAASTANRWAWAITPALVFFGAGVLLGSQETIVFGSPSSGERKVIAGPKVSRWAGYGILSLLAAFYLFLTFTTVRGSAWIINLILGLFLSAAGYQMGPLLNVVRLSLRRASNLLVFAAQSVWLAFSRLMQFTVVVLEFVFYMFAAPIDRFRPVNRPHVQEETLKARSANEGI